MERKYACKYAYEYANGVANPNPKTDHLESTKWKPGEAPNPKGYSRGRRATDALLALIDAENADQDIARVWLEAMRRGDFRYFKEYIDRVEGKTPDVVKHDGDGDKRAPYEIKRRRPKKP